MQRNSKNVNTSNKKLQIQKHAMYIQTKGFDCKPGTVYRYLLENSMAHHHGIIIHPTLAVGFGKENGVVLEEYRDLKDRKCEKLREPSDVNEAMLIVIGAIQNLGLKDYSLFTNNCQHWSDKLNTHFLYLSFF